MARPVSVPASMIAVIVALLGGDVVVEHREAHFK
jgi:hypothetical protein